MPSGSSDSCDECLAGTYAYNGTSGCLDCTKGKDTVTNAWQGPMLTMVQQDVWIVQKVRIL